MLKISTSISKSTDFKMHTKTGFDQENRAPDKAKDTQSAGLPDHMKINNQRTFHSNSI